MLPPGGRFYLNSFWRINNRFVSEAITAKVEAAIKELNYAPSALARSLKLNQTHTIGMLITASTNPLFRTGAWR
ncbi:LacI family DNA-binding transcriptional regulator [Escherichia coli]